MHPDDDSAVSELLRQADLAPRVDEGRFDRRLFRRWGAMETRRGLRYWWPVAVAAAVVAVGFGALLQFVGKSRHMAPLRVPNGDAAYRTLDDTAVTPDIRIR